MEIFLSWSGHRTQLVARALRKWLPRVNRSFKPWMSEEDIQPGVRWREDLLETLETIDLAIVCIDGASMHSPWVHFEAGAISKNLEKSSLFVFLIAVNDRDLTGPLGEYQATPATKEGTLRLVGSLNKKLDTNALSDLELQDSFNAWWPLFEEDLKSALSQSPQRLVEIGKHGLSETSAYREFFNELMIYAHQRKMQPWGGYKKRQERFRELVEQLSLEHFEQPRPPVPDDPIVGAFFNRIEPLEFSLRCSFCEVDCRPNKEGCCARCGLFCTFWAMKLKQSAFRKLWGVGLAGTAVSVGLAAAAFAVLTWFGDRASWAAYDFPAASKTILYTLLAASACLGFGLTFYHLPPSLRGNCLVTTGPYKYVRHPLYTLIIVLGPLLLFTWLGSWLYLALFPILWLVWRNLVIREEVWLDDTFRPDYEHYCKATGQFFPRLSTFFDQSKRG